MRRAYPHCSRVGLLQGREKGTGAVNGALGSSQDERGARNVVVMGRRDCGCGKGGLRTSSSESSTFFAFSKWRHDRPNGPGFV
jgi:hypothetical protein